MGGLPGRLIASQLVFYGCLEVEGFHQHSLVKDYSVPITANSALIVMPTLALGAGGCPLQSAMCFSAEGTLPAAAIAPSQVEGKVRPVARGLQGCEELGARSLILSPFQSKQPRFTWPSDPSSPPQASSPPHSVAAPAGSWPQEDALAVGGQFVQEEEGDPGPGDKGGPWTGPGTETWAATGNRCHSSSPAGTGSLAPHRSSPCTTSCRSQYTLLGAVPP